jgi:hypothetical protein
MGTRREAGRLSATCPLCKSVWHADELTEITKLVSKCCGKQKKAVLKPHETLRAPVDRPMLPTTPWSIDVDRVIISQNKTTYSHWTVYNRDKRGWLTHLRVRTRELQGLRLGWSRWRFERHYASPAKEMDYANIVGGFKPVPDCLIELGIIMDDKPSMFEASYGQVKDTTNFTVITLQDCIGSI